MSTINRSAASINLPTSDITGGVRQIVNHDSAHKHVSGEAIYCDDINTPADTLHVYIGKSEHAHATINNIDLTDVLTAEGVIAVLTADDIAGKNDWSAIAGDDPVFATDTAQYHGQPLFAVIATSHLFAMKAARQAKIDYTPLSAILTAKDGFAANRLVADSHSMQIGDSTNAINNSPYQLSGELEIGGQEQFYLEGQIAYARPAEDNDMVVISSTQHPHETQHVVGRVLGLHDNEVVVKVRRMGGGFGGKETNGNFFAAIAALAAQKTKKPCKFRADRDDDFLITGKRHPMTVEYQVGFDDEGILQGLEINFFADCGYSADLSRAIVDRAMYHADNAYFCGNSTFTGHCCYTNKVSNTAFRGFGGPQGMLAMEHIIERIATTLGADALTIRQRNLYDNNHRNITPYHMTLTDFVSDEILAEVAESANYQQRVQAVLDYNQTHRHTKKGIAITPVKFGISFTTTFLNQASALLHIYSDGSVMINQGGTEMGQGLYIKVAQVVAEALQIDVGKIKITATDTSKIPNTSATAASSGADLNGMAALDAANKLKTRLQNFAAEQYNIQPEDVIFTNNHIQLGDSKISFEALVNQAYLNRIPLSATGFYKTPAIYYDRETSKGRPFYYFANGAACAEVLIDCFTGESRVLRADILHDVGKSLNPAIDLGQVEGGFVQGMGWLTNEELWWNSKGELRTHAPSTYKIPTASDRPLTLNCKLWRKGRCAEETIHRSKGVGEPPLMLAMSVFFALQKAVNAARAEQQKTPISINSPATAETLLLAINQS
jgi:xanthine dehydrogenase large subunit